MGQYHLSNWFLERSGRKYAFLDGWMMTLRCPMTNPWFWWWIRVVDKDRRISCPKNQMFRKLQRPNGLKIEKDLKNGFSRKFGDHGFLMPVWSPFRLFFLPFLFGIYFLIFLYIFCMISIHKTWWEAAQKEEQSLWFCRKAEDFVAQRR